MNQGVLLFYWIINYTILYVRNVVCLVIMEADEPISRQLVYNATLNVVFENCGWS